jgi:preprotein translocase subunit SecG
MLLGLLLSLNILVCLALIGVVLLQRSEGGALGGGGNPTGLITSRGAGDLLTRTTWILFGLFLALSLALTLLGGHQRSSDQILNRLKGETINPDQIKRPAAPAPTGAASPGPLSAPKPVIAPATNAPVPASSSQGFLAPPKPVVGLTPNENAPAKPNP